MEFNDITSLRLSCCSTETLCICCVWSSVCLCVCWQASDVIVNALNQNLVEFELKPGARVIVYNTQLTLGKATLLLFNAVTESSTVWHLGPPPEGRIWAVSCVKTQIWHGCQKNELALACQAWMIHFPHLFFLIFMCHETSLWCDNRNFSLVSPLKFLSVCHRIQGTGSRGVREGPGLKGSFMRAGILYVCHQKLNICSPSFYSHPSTKWVLRRV